MIKLTLDTSCFDKQSEKLINELNNLQEEGLIEIWHETYVEIEKEDWISTNKTAVMNQLHSVSKSKHDAFPVPANIMGDLEKLQEYIERQQGYTCEELHKIHSEIDRIVYPEIVYTNQEEYYDKHLVNKYLDNKMLALHIVRKRDIFVTKDKVLFREDEKYKKIEKKFSTKVRLFNQDFIRELKELIRRD